MGWIARAFVRGVLISIPVIAAVIAFGSGKTSPMMTIDAYDPLVLVLFVSIAIWLGVANLLSVMFERRKNGKNQDQ